MVRLLSVVILTPFLLVTASPALAQIPPGATQQGNLPAVVIQQQQLPIPQQRAAYRQKLGTIKDARKKAVVEKLDTQIATVNTKATTKMTESLTKLSTLLERVATLSATYEAWDPTTLDDARTALTTAKQTVTTQAAKQYVIPLTEEAALGQNVKTTILALRTDLKTSHEAVVTAKTAVVAAIRNIMQSQPQSVSDAMEGEAE